MANTTLEKWEEKTLGEICEFRNGLWTGKKEPFIECNVIRNANFSKDFKLNYDNVVRISVEEKQFHPRELKYGDLILEKSGGGPNQPVGRVVIFDKHENGYSFSNFTSLIRIKNKELINFRFLYLYLCYCYLSGMTIKMQKNSTGIRNLIFDEYKNIRAPIPNIKEQERIVAKLDKAFEAIDKVKASAEQNLNNAKELFESALDKAFTENTEGWEEKTLEKIGNIQTGTTPKTSEKDNFGNYIPFIKPADFNPDGTLNYNNEGLSEKGLKVARFIPKNSVLMVCIGATITKTGYSEIDTTCNQQINTLTPTKDSCKFIYYAMVRKEFKEKILAGCPQTTLPIINKSNWSALTIKLPKIDEQQKIVEQLDKIQEQTKQFEAIYTQKIKECDELKQSILQKAFRGEL